MRSEAQPYPALPVKLCGLTSLEQLDRFAAMGGWAAGFIFVPWSKRSVSRFRLDAVALRRHDAPIIKIGVFVNEGYDTILETAAAYGLQGVQLHGEESPELCRRLKRETMVIKALSVPAGSLPDTGAFEGAADHILLDAGRGGTGKKWDWVFLSQITHTCMLSGGIGPGDAAAIRRLDPRLLAAIDINSRFETAPGIKDFDAVQDFMNQLNENVWKK